MRVEFSLQSTDLAAGDQKYSCPRRAGHFWHKAVNVAQSIVDKQRAWLPGQNQLFQFGRRQVGHIKTMTGVIDSLSTSHLHLRHARVAAVPAALYNRPTVISVVFSFFT